MSLTGMKEKLEELLARVGLRTITSLNHGLPKADIPIGIRFVLGWEFEKIKNSVVRKEKQICQIAPAIRAVNIQTKVGSQP